MTTDDFLFLNFGYLYVTFWTLNIGYLWLFILKPMARQSIKTLL